MKRNDLFAVCKLAARGARPHAGRFAAIAIAATCASAHVQAASDTATAFVQKSANEAIVVLQKTSVPADQRKAQFKTVLLRSFDAPSIGRFVTGSYWQAANPAQQARFQSTFEAALARIYTERFFDYDGESLQVKGTHPSAGGATVVQTVVSSPGTGKTYDVDWVVSGNAGNQKFLDVVIDGVSTSMTTKQDYTSVLRSANGNLDALSTALQRKEAE